jgi:mannosyltransferase
MVRWWPALSAAVLMLTLGLVGATGPVLSWDEIATADVAQRSVPQIWNMLHHIDGVFGPYYLLMHLWTAFVGDSVPDLRLPSILAMAGAVAAAAELGRRLFDAGTGALAGLLLCLIPNLSRYAAEARPYAFACLFATLSLLLLCRAIDQPLPARWVAYSSSVLALGLSHIVGLTTLLGHAGILALRAGWRRRHVWTAWSAAVAAPLVILLPIVWWGVHQRQAQLYWVPPVTAGAVYAFPARMTGNTATGWLLIGLTVAAVLARRHPPVLELLLAALIPPMLVGAVSAAGPSFWVIRYLLFVLMPATVVAAAGMTWMVRGMRRRSAVTMSLAAAAVVAAAALPAQIAVRGPTVKNGSDYRTLAGMIRTRQEPGDVIVYQRGRTMRAGVDYYLRRDREAPQDVLERVPAANLGSLTAGEYPDPQVRLRTAGRLWLVLYGRRADPLTGRRDLAAMVRTRFQRAGRWTVKGGTLALYLRSTASAPCRCQPDQAK